MYKCFSCKKEVSIEGKVRCTHCGFRILVKARPDVVKRVPAL